MKLSNYFTKIVCRQPSSIIAVLLSFFMMGGFVWHSYLQFLYLQAQSINGLSVFNEILLPLAGLSLACQLIIMMVSTVGLVPHLKQARQDFLLTQASINQSKIFWSLNKPVLILSSIPLGYFALIAVFLSIYSNLDWGRVLPSIVGLCCINFAYYFVIMGTCLLCRRTLAAIIFSISSVMFFVFLEIMLGSIISADYWRGIFSIFLLWREGSISIADLLRVLAILLILSSTCYLIFIRKQVLNRTIAFSGLFLGSVLVIFAWIVPAGFDVSQSQRNTLSTTIQQQLTSHSEPLEIIAVINDETAKDEITRGFNIVKAFYPNSQLSFKSRQQLPPQMQHAGEYLQLSLGDLHQALAYPFQGTTKAAIETALIQMLGRKSQWITFVEGHGEASPFGKTSSDLSQLYQVLKQSGWPVAVQNLNVTPFISDNTEVLVVAAGKQQWLTKEIRLINDYLERGGNLLVLLDPTSVFPEVLSARFGITRYPGTLVDWSGYQSGTPHPAVVIIRDFGQHPLVSQLSSLLAFPWSAGLIVESQSTDYSVEPVLKTHSGVWNEFNIESDTLQFDEAQGEQQQSYNLVVALQSKQLPQRIVFVGDSHFISDSAINNYANKQFSLNLFSWLTNVDFEKVMVTQNQDSNILVTRLSTFLLTWGVGLILPVLLLVSWYLLNKRRRANYESKHEAN